MVAVLNNLLEIETETPHPARERVMHAYDAKQELASAFGFSPDELADCLLGAAPQLTVEHAGKNAEKLREIKALWEDQFEADGLKLWVRRTVPLFGGNTPLQLFRQGKFEETLHLLTMFQEGIPL